MTILLSIDFWATLFVLLFVFKLYWKYVFKPFNDGKKEQRRDCQKTVERNQLLSIDKKTLGALVKKGCFDKGGFS